MPSRLAMELDQRSTPPGLNQADDETSQKRQSVSSKDQNGSSNGHGNTGASASAKEPASSASLQTSTPSLSVDQPPAKHGRERADASPPPRAPSPPQQETHHKPIDQDCAPQYQQPYATNKDVYNSPYHHPYPPIGPMPHRVEPYPMHSMPPQRSNGNRRYDYDQRPSPPPIATLTHSHSPTPSIASLDRSSVSTPPMRRSPPPVAPHHHHHHHSHAPPPPMYYPPDHRYAPYGPTPHGYHQHSHPIPPMIPYPLPPSSGLQIVYTEDAATKLSDRVRRRCFNCCTTDTSTWRRSNLSPGKVLCNKCGLFERTHSRPRPEQFPHKRGPLAGASLRRSPPNGFHGMPPGVTAAQAPPPPPASLPPPPSGSGITTPAVAAHAQAQVGANGGTTLPPMYALQDGGALPPPPKLPGVQWDQRREGKALPPIETND